MPKICYNKTRFSAESASLIKQANDIIGEYTEQGYDLTLRQIYYQFVSRGFISNTVQSYKRLGSVISNGRMSGLIDWKAIIDRTRNLRGNLHWYSPRDIVSACASQYDMDLWVGQSVYCEVWIEKEALVGVIERVCRELDVPYFACRGYVSQSEMWKAGQRFARRKDKTCIVFHFGDHDPSGIDMTRDIEDRLTKFGAKIRMERVALNMSQVEMHNPPPNPAKMTDSRFSEYMRTYGESSWELDALEPSTIEGLVRSSVEGVMDKDKFRNQAERRAIGRGQIDLVARNWNAVLTHLGGETYAEEA